MDIAAVAMAEFAKWTEENCEHKDEGVFAYKEYLFDLTESQAGQDKLNLRIFKVSKDEPDQYILVAKIMDFLKEDEIRFVEGQREVLEEIRSIIEADEIAKQMVQTVREGTKDHKAMVQTLRQYG